MFRLSRVARCLIALLLCGIALPAIASALLAGTGAGESADTARAEAREDLAQRLRRTAAVRLERSAARPEERLRRAIAGGRELPLIGIEEVRVGARRFEARLTGASLAAYLRESAKLSDSLRVASRGQAAQSDSAESIAQALARHDQLQRIRVVLRIFNASATPDEGTDEAIVLRRAVERLPLTSSAGEIARSVAAKLERNRLAAVRIVAPVRADTWRVTGFSGAIADALRAALGAAASGRPVRHTLDGRYQVIDGKILLVLYLMDSSFNTELALPYVLPIGAERGFASAPSKGGLSRALNRGLVRIESLDDGASGAQPAASAGGIGVDVQTGRGKRALYYHPGDRDNLFVKLDRPGYYYIVGHIEKEKLRLSYLMEIGRGGGSSRFVRKVSDAEAGRWQRVGEFTVEPPLGEEAVQVFASTHAPDKALPTTRYDAAQQLHIIGGDPAEVVRRTRGLVRIEMADTKASPGARVEARQTSFGEAVLEFSTLP